MYYAIMLPKDKTLRSRNSSIQPGRLQLAPDPPDPVSKDKKLQAPLPPVDWVETAALLTSETRASCSCTVTYLEILFRDLKARRSPGAGEEGTSKLARPLRRCVRVRIGEIGRETGAESFDYIHEGTIHPRQMFQNGVGELCLITRGHVLQIVGLNLYHLFQVTDPGQVVEMQVQALSTPGASVRGFVSVCILRHG